MLEGSRYQISWGNKEADGQKGRKIFNSDRDNVARKADTEIKKRLAVNEM